MYNFQLGNLYLSLISDENTIIIHDAITANIYLQEFEKRWCELEIGGCVTTEISELINIEISISPNPSSGIININSDLKINQINLYAVDGKYLSTTESKTIDIAIKGIYFLKIITDKGITVRKVIVE